MKKKKKSGSKFSIGAVFIICLFILFGYAVWVKYTESFHYVPDTQILINKGDTIAKFYSYQKGLSKFMTRLWIRNHISQIPPLQEGTYTLSGEYTKFELLEHIAKGPKQEFLRITLLEWRSIFDTDAHLADQGLITAGEYIQKVQNQDFISGLRDEFPFLAILPEGKSLEGFLYPDTYFLDKHGLSVQQLIKAQLKNFNEKVWKLYREDFLSFRPQNLPLSKYAALVLASVIENEEKNLTNKPIIAGIFINRIEQGMRLDADVTLCYGLQIKYDECRAAILLNLNDASNLYNTRKNIGLPPTPISSPSVATINALFHYKNTNALYYLHDEKGQIHYWTTLEEHNQNKSNHL